MPKDPLIDGTFSAQVPGINAAVLFRGRDGEAIGPRGTYQCRWMIRGLHAMVGFMIDSE